MFGIGGGGSAVRSAVDIVWAWKIEELLNDDADKLSRNCWLLKKMGVLACSTAGC